MARTVTFYDSATQKKTVVENVEANTLGELKAAVAGKGISFENKSILEGVSGTSLLSDSSYLPSNVCHEGVTTNDLMIYMTPKKNINSGCDDPDIDPESANPYLGMDDMDIAKIITKSLLKATLGVQALVFNKKTGNENKECSKKEKQSEKDNKGFSDSDIKKMLEKLGKTQSNDKREELFEKLANSRCPAEFVSILIENIDKL